MTIAKAKAYVAKHHRHHRPPQGGLFAVGVESDGTVCGVAIVGRPVARMLDDGRTAEVTRLCTDGTRNACSFLYAACWRAARALGYRRIVTYILASESGGSLKASGWVEKHRTDGGSWTSPSRPRIDKHPTCPKIRFELEDQ